MKPESAPNYPAVPISPDEVLGVKAESFPEEVYIAVNGLIAERIQGQYARFTVKALVKRMVALGLEETEVRQRNWQQVGAIYQKAGWEVSYRSPGMDDNDFEPYYSFHTKGARSW